MSDRKKILIPIAVAAAGVLGTLALVASRPTVEKAPKEVLPPNVRVLEVQPATIPVTVRSQGSVEPKTEARLVSEVAGRIVRVSPSFEVGSFVRHGQHLAYIDQRDYEVNLASQQAALAQAKVLLERESAEAEVARKEWDALGKGGTPNPLVLRQPQLQEARARVDAAAAAVRRAELDLDRTIVRAPFTGRIRSKAIDVGGFVTRGTAIASLYSVDSAEVRLPIPDSELAFMDSDVGIAGRGPAVELEAEFGGQLRRWSGRIVRAEGEIDARTRMVTLIAAVKDPYGLEDPVEAPLGVGLFVNAAIEGKPIAEGYLLPRRALRRDGQMVIVDQDRLRIRAVRVVRSNADQVVIDQGLQPGDKVVVSKLDVATDGMLVNALPAEAGTHFSKDVLSVGPIATDQRAEERGSESNTATTAAPQEDTAVPEEALESER